MELTDWSRYLIALFFFIFGIQNLKSRDMILSVMKQNRIPWATFIFYYGVFYEFVLTFCLFANYYTSLSALFLMLFVFVAIMMFHPFWKMSGEFRRLNQIIFITNSTIVMGALLSLINLHDLLDLWREGMTWLKFIK